MNIMFNISSMGKGGAERVIANLSNALIDKNEVEIIVNIKGNTVYNLDSRIKVIELDKKRKNVIARNIKRIIRTQKFIKQEKPDIIISFLPMPSYRVLLLRKINKIPIIVSDRNNPEMEYKSLINKILMKLLYKKADGFVFQTTQQRDYFPENIKNKSVIISNPIKDEFLYKIDRKKENIIINVGRLVPQKNQKLLIDAFSKIADEYKNYTLKIFGDGPLKESLNQQIKSLKMEDRIKLSGVIEDIKTELEKANLFILSSDYEGMPNALIEAMAVGLPVISTDCPCGGPKELIENEKSGILVPIQNERLLKEAIEKVLNDKKFSDKLGENAKNITKKVSKDKIIKQWEEYIKEIINK